MPERLLIPKEDLVHLTHGTVVNRHQNPVIGANMSQNDLNFALFSAVISGNLSLVKLYLEAGAIPDASLNLREVETGNTVIMTSLHAIGEAFANGISILLLLPIIAEFLEQPSDPYV
ncbi:MAG: hypothetical protein K0T99_03140, partial [Alphaproteobacteria bacterium]|nr:hypothetical protein [Alphaproteobacteria bacterium]